MIQRERRKRRLQLYVYLLSVTHVSGFRQRLFEGLRDVTNCSYAARRVHSCSMSRKRRRALHLISGEAYETLDEDQQTHEHFSLDRRKPLSSSNVVKRAVKSLDALSEPFRWLRNFDLRLGSSGSSPPEGTGDNALDDALISLEAYQHLQTAGLLPSFSTAVESVLQAETASVEEMENVTGVPAAHLSAPDWPQTTWLAFVGICMLAFLVSGSEVTSTAMEIGKAKAAGILPAGPLLPTQAEGIMNISWWCLILLYIDRQLLNAGFLRSCAVATVPILSQRALVHEAGHFHVSHLLGYCVSDYCTAGWSSLKKGQGLTGGHTIVHDPLLVTQCFNEGSEWVEGQDASVSIKKIAVVLMAGIAAEALAFGSAYGGSNDIFQLRQTLRQREPSLSDSQIEEWERFGIVEACQILKAGHPGSIVSDDAGRQYLSTEAASKFSGGFKRLLDAMAQQKGVGTCILALEGVTDASL